MTIAISAKGFTFNALDVNVDKVFLVSVPVLASIIKSCLPSVTQDSLCLRFQLSLLLSANERVNFLGWNIGEP